MSKKLKSLCFDFYAPFGGKQEIYTLNLIIGTYFKCKNEKNQGYVELVVEYYRSLQELYLWFRRFSLRQVFVKKDEFWKYVFSVNTVSFGLSKEDFFMHSDPKKRDFMIKILF